MQDNGTESWICKEGKSWAPHLYWDCEDDGTYTAKYSAAYVADHVSGTKSVEGIGAKCYLNINNKKFLISTMWVVYQDGRFKRNEFRRYWSGVTYPATFTSEGIYMPSTLKLNYGITLVESFKNV